MTAGGWPSKDAVTVGGGRTSKGSPYGQNPAPYKAHFGFHQNQYTFYNCP